MDCRGSEFGIAEDELRITNPVAERIERLAMEISVSPVLHGVIIEVGELIDALIESNWELARRIVDSESVSAIAVPPSSPAYQQASRIVFALCAAQLTARALPFISTTIRGFPCA